VPFDSRAYRVLIASPSDVEEEREIAVRVIQEWNDLYSYSRNVVLLPLRWETHTAPEYGTRPQEVINRAIVDQCDLLVGIFWTRIGTPTGTADSGTIEEITRVANAGKPVMLYFSKIGTDPDRLDLTQFARLKEFKDRTYPNALTESFKSQIEFRDKFAKQLELKVRDLQKADDKQQPPPLKLILSAAGSEGVHLTASVTLPVVENLRDVLAEQPDDTHKSIEKAVENAVDVAVSIPVRLQISNTGASGIRNLFVQVTIRPASGQPDIVDAAQVRLRAWGWTRYLQFEPDLYGGGLLPSLGLAETEGLTKRTDGWQFSFEWDALQPQRTRTVRPELVIRSLENARIEFQARVFADSFPEPFEITTDLEIIVDRKTATVADLVDIDAAVKLAEKARK